jgi:hypothetical protein
MFGIPEVSLHFRYTGNFEQDLLRKGVIRKSYSQYASPAFLVPKHDGGHRMVVDYRLLDRKIVFDAFPMPTVETLVTVKTLWTQIMLVPLGDFNAPGFNWESGTPLHK